MTFYCVCILDLLRSQLGFALNCLFVLLIKYILKIWKFRDIFFIRDIFVIVGMFVGYISTADRLDDNMHEHGGNQTCEH